MEVFLIFYLSSQLLLAQNYLTLLAPEIEFAEFIKDSNKEWRKPV